MTTMDRLRTLARDRGLTVDSNYARTASSRHALDEAARTRDPGVEETMHEFKRGQLRSGSKRGPKVTSRKQAIAIALSKQRRGDSRDAVQHDPHTGRFTGAHQHEAAAEHHEEMAGYHEMHSHEARARGKNQEAVAHGKAMRAHEQATRAHNAGARSFAAPGYLQRVAPHASEASRHAAEMSRRTGSRHHDAALQWDRIRRRAQDRGLRVGDAIRHDPRSGQFTSAGQHTAAAEQHEEEAANHETAAHGTRGEASSLHRGAMSAHAIASRAHKVAARHFGSPGYPRHAESAHTASAIAQHRSRQAGGA